MKSEEEFEKWCNEIKVCKKVNYYNPLITDYQKEMAYRSKRDEEHKFYDMFRYSYSLHWQQNQSKIPYRKNKAVLSIEVSKKQINRASQIMETFIKCVNQLDGKVEVEYGDADNTKLNLFNTRFFSS